MIIIAISLTNNRRQRFAGIPVLTRNRGAAHVWSRIQCHFGPFLSPVLDSVSFRFSPGFSIGFV